MARICIVDYDMSLTGGVERVTANLALAFAEKHDVSVTSIFFNQGSPAYELPGINFTYLKHDYHYRAQELLPMAGALYRHITRNNYDIIFLQGDVAGFLGGLVRKFHRNIPYTVFCTHGALINQWNELSVRTFRKTAARHCDRTVTLTGRDRNDYIGRLGIPENRISYIYNWIDDNARHSCKYNADSKRIISAGRLEKEKGYDMLVAAFRTVAEKHPDWALDIYGNGSERSALETEISRQNLSENVFLRGESRNLADLYGDYSFYVMSSKREGLPLVLLEAQANLLPAVSFDIISGPNEIIQNNANGLLVPPENISALSDAMCRLIQSRELRTKMSENTYTVFEKFSRFKILKQWDSIIESAT